MSVNHALNAVIALLEDRPAQFKELLRAPESNVQNISEVRARLQTALSRYAATQIRGGLIAALHVTPDGYDETGARIFFEGVRATEEVFETLARRLEG
jgi:hypothetical protein